MPQALVMPINILILSDGRPGHYNQSEGVAEAIARRALVEVVRYDIRKSPLIAARMLRASIRAGRDPRKILRFGYGLDPDLLPPADLVISTGGKTMPANIALAAWRGIPNIFVGSPRGVPDTSFSLALTIYERYRDRPNHVVTLKPSRIDPRELARPAVVPIFSAANPPRKMTLLLGGDSELVYYRMRDWRALADFTEVAFKAWGTRWRVTTSPRTPPNVARLFKGYVGPQGPIEHLVDYRRVTEPSLLPLLRNADAVMCTADSNSMLTEAITGRFPVIDVLPPHHRFTSNEQEYRDRLHNAGWCHELAIADLTPQRVGDALSRIRPLDHNPMETLADIVAEHIPRLFALSTKSAQPAAT